MNHKSGFTLVELMLAMSFVSVLLVAVAMTTIQIGNIYTKGITLKAVNQAGRSMAEDLQRYIAASAPFEVSGSESKFISVGEGGRLCMGRHTYVWNNGAALADGTTPPPNRFADLSAPHPRFVRVGDRGGEYCSNPTEHIDREQSVELLSDGDRELAVHNFEVVSNSATNRDNLTSQRLYRVSFVIGTNEQADILTVEQSCKPPVDSETEGRYCAVNKFDIVARAGNFLLGE